MSYENQDNQDNQDNPEITNFAAEQFLSNQAQYGGLKFSFYINHHQFSGQLIGNEINWMQPSPAQTLDPDKQAIIETKIRQLMGQGGNSNNNHHIAMEEAFEGRTYERRQVVLNIEGTEYRGFVQDGDIHWFQPHPTQKLGTALVESIESDIHNQSDKL